MPVVCATHYHSTLRNLSPISIGDTIIDIIDDVKRVVKLDWDSKPQTISLKFIIMQKIAMYLQTDAPIIFHVQLNVISEHLILTNLDT